MTKLDDIVSRNRRASRPREHVLVGILVGVFILVIIGLAAFTDLGQPPDDPTVAPAPPAKVLHVPLGAPRRRAPTGSGQGAQ